MIAVLLIVLAIAVLAAAGWWIAQARLDRAAPPPDAKLPLFSARPADRIGAPTQHHISEEPPAEVTMLRRGRAIDPTTPKTTRAVAPEQAVGEQPSAATDERANGTTPRHSPRVPADPRAPTAPQAAVVPGREAPPPAAAPFDEATARDGTMQFLPGRLEVLQGRGVVEQEVRFVRPARGQAPEVTFGRGEGPPLTHVQLRAPTVSRLHARLVQQSGGGWALENLSATNPVVVNGQEIPRGAPPRPLADGDRLEMGEVVFRYHAR